MEQEHVRTVIADPEFAVRRGLCDLFGESKRCLVVGVVSEGSTLLQVVRRSRPHVVILDFMGPGAGGMGLLTKLRTQAPGTRPLVFSNVSGKAVVREALSRGAFGYVLKQGEESHLVGAIERVRAGERYLDPSLDAAVLLEQDSRAWPTRPADPYEALTLREREVLLLTAEGVSSREVGNRLHISQRTAENHRANLMRKLGLHSQVEVIYYAMRRGLLVPAGEGPEGGL